jgi:hypothetical protein
MKYYLVIFCIFSKCHFNEPKKNETVNHTFSFSSSHHQFYICDKTSPLETGDDDFWTTEAFDSKLAVGEGILGVGTASYSSCKGELMILDQKNDKIFYEQYDHIVEGSLEVSSGILQILDCSSRNVQLQIKIDPGVYRVRIYSSNFDSVIDENGDDFYRIEMWPSEEPKRLVLKQYRTK